MDRISSTSTVVVPAENHRPVVMASLVRHPRILLSYGKAAGRTAPSLFSRAVKTVRVATVLLVALVLGWSLPVAAQRFDRGLLWRIETLGAPVSHVFGTIHVSDKRVTQVPAAVSRALGDARSLSIEVGLDLSNIMALATRMVFLDGRDLAGAVGQKLYEKTAALTSKLGIPEPALRLFKPWAIALLLSVPQQNPDE